jgi:hypothetical protein
MENELYHHGILGMRWGVRRYQNADGTLTAAGRKRLEKKETKTEADKQAIIKSGSAEIVQKHQAELSNEELKKAIERIDLNQRLSDVKDKQKANAAKKVERVANTVKNISTIGSSGIKIYNTMATVRNAFSTSNKKWRTIGKDSVKTSSSKSSQKTTKSSDSNPFSSASSKSSTRAKSASFVNRAAKKAQSFTSKKQARKAAQKGKAFTSSSNVTSTAIVTTNYTPSDEWFDFSGR